MSFLSLEDLDNSQELGVAEPGEHEIRITDVKQDDDKNGKPYLLPRFELADGSKTKDFTKFLRLPFPEMEPKQLNNCRVQLKKFFQAFQIDYHGDIDLEGMIGLTAYAILGVEEDEQYGENNYVKSFVTGH